MKSVPHLLIEDRPEFERVLNEALRAAADAPPGAPCGNQPRLTTEQQRAMALSAAAAICACAAAEYDHYVTVRQRQRESRRVPVARVPGGGTAHGTTGRGTGDASAGAGLAAVAAVLTPLLAGAAAVIFLLVGYALDALAPPPSIAASLRTAGWLFAAIAVGGVLCGMVGLVLTAIRDGSSAIRPTPRARRGGGVGSAPADDVTAAKEAWLAALRERGVRPFLREALASAVTSADRS